MNPFLFAAVLVLLPVCIRAETGEWYGPEYRQCRDGTTVDIVACLAGRTAYWNRRLSEAYQTLIARLGADRKNQLRQAQRLWLEYREANCHFYHSGPGSISRIESAECKRVLTARRASDLEQALRP